MFKVPKQAYTAEFKAAAFFVKDLLLSTPRLTNTAGIIRCRRSVRSFR
jgi:hypothetical protein